MKLLALSTAIAALLSGSTGAVAARWETELDVLETRFGYFWQGSDGLLRLRETRVIPYRAGVEFGWGIRLSSPDEAVAWREVHLAPPAEPAADAWLPDRRVVEKRDLAQDGWIFNTHVVGERTVSGWHALAVEVQGQLVQSVIFHLSPEAWNGSDLEPAPLRGVVDLQTGAPLQLPPARMSSTQLTALLELLNHPR